MDIRNLFAMQKKSLSSTLAKNSNKVATSSLNSSIEEIEDLNSVFVNDTESVGDDDLIAADDVEEFSPSETTTVLSTKTRRCSSNHHP